MKEVFRLCAVLTIIAAVSAGVLAFVSQKTAEPIADAMREEELQAIREVLPPFENEPDQDTVVLEEAGESIVFYRGRTEGRITGIAFVVTAPNGYSGDIRFMIGVDDSGIVQGIEILKHAETPGLGAKIESQSFRDRYKGKSLTNPEQWDVVKDGGTFKQITGATISSRAVTHAIARGLELFEERRADILGPGKPEEGATTDTLRTHEGSREPVEGKADTLGKPDDSRKPGEGKEEPHKDGR
ncbi:MAG: RnfABCDGE type electron transport complex subunit G [bacterium]|nr:MAG: RnfABCDGE type electron transport complex subunit G [bacterium]